jgi:hypothetical protein
MSDTSLLDVDHDPVVIIDGMTKNMRVSIDDDHFQCTLKGGGGDHNS